jgi:arsenite methyltransferase
MANSVFRKARICVLALALVFAASSQRAREAPIASHEFQDTANWAKIFESPERAEWQKPDQVVSALKLESGQTVVDIGAGTGYFTRRFARAVAPTGKAIGLDIEPDMVEYMKADAKKLKLPNYQARLVKADDPELAPRSVDVAFFCDVLHHIDARVFYMRKLEPALKPGGRVAVIDFKQSAPLGPPISIRIPSEEMIAEFKRAGYRLIAEHRFLPYQYFLEFAPGS